MEHLPDATTRPLAVAPTSSSLELSGAGLVQDPARLRFGTWISIASCSAALFRRGAPLALEAPASIAAEYFAERRELGVLNIGASGAITVDGQRYAMNKRDARVRRTRKQEISCSRARTRRDRRGSTS